MYSSNTIRVLEIDDYQATTALTVRELLNYVIPGRAFLPKAKNDPVTAREVRSLASYHRVIQRDLTGAKLTNARGPLRDYVLDEWLCTDRPPRGVLPSFYVAFKEQLRYASPHELVIPPGTRGILLDAESRVESFLYIIEDPGTSEEVVAALYERRVQVGIYHGLPAEVAAKYFSDMNGRGVGVNATLIAGRDISDPYRQIAARVFEEKLGLELEYEKRQVGARSNAIMTVLQARLMVAAVAHGVNAVTYGAKKIPAADVNLERLEVAAHEWFRQMFTALPPADWRDQDKVLRAVPVMVSLAAMGRGFYTGDADEQARAHAFLADRSIDWSSGHHWGGIAGKVNASTGRFTVGSGKECAHATLRALRELGDASAIQVRRQRPATPTPILVSSEASPQA